MQREPKGMATRVMPGVYALIIYLAQKHHIRNVNNGWVTECYNNNIIYMWWCVTGTVVQFEW